MAVQRREPRKTCLSSVAAARPFTIMREIIRTPAVQPVGQYDVRAPLLFGREEANADSFGASVWLWVHSPLHRDAPLHSLPTLLLPIIECQQYVLVAHQNKPVFFFSWAWLSEDAEARYLTKPALLMPEADWRSGERFWICDWIAPFGHTADMRRLILHDLFPTHCMRALYHRGQTRGKRVLMFHGVRVTKDAARQWFSRHPLATASFTATQPAPTELRTDP